MTPYAVIVASSSSHLGLLSMLALIGAMGWIVQALPRQVGLWLGSMVLVGALGGAALYTVTETTNVIMPCSSWGCLLDTIFW